MRYLASKANRVLSMTMRISFALKTAALCGLTTGTGLALPVLIAIAISVSSSQALSDEAKSSRVEGVVVVSRISAAETFDLERAAALFQSESYNSRTSDEFSLTASCVFLVSEAVVEYLKEIPRGEESASNFVDFPAFAILQVNSTTIYKLNAGRQVWQANGRVYSLSESDASFLYGFFRGLRLENGCQPIEPKQ
jgi:hypothetical protein